MIPSGQAHILVIGLGEQEFYIRIQKWYRPKIKSKVFSYGLLLGKKAFKNNPDEPDPVQFNWEENDYSESGFFKTFGTLK